MEHKSKNRSKEELHAEAEWDTVATQEGKLDSIAGMSNYSADKLIVKIPARSPQEMRTPRGYSHNKTKRSSGCSSSYPHKNSYSSGLKKLIDIGEGRYLDRRTYLGNVKFFVVKCHTLAQTLLCFFISICIACILAMLVIVIMHHTRPKQPWELLHTPPAVEFDEYSIVSSNEFCNELARMTVQEDHVPFLGLVLVMDLCLSLTEPQAGGWGGDSVVVYSNAKNNGCYQIQGIGRDIWRLDDSMTEFRKAFVRELKQRSDAHFNGGWSSRIPGNAFVIVGALELFVKEFPQANLSVIMETLAGIYSHEFDKLFIPISPRLDEAFTVLMAAGTHAFESTTNLFGREGRQLVEGDLFHPLRELNKYHPLLIDKAYKSWKGISKLRYRVRRFVRRHFIDTAMFFAASHELFFFQNSFFEHYERVIQDKKNVFYSAGSLTDLGDGLKICSAYPSTKESPLVPKMLQRYAKSQTRDRRQGMESIKKLGNIYTEIIRQFYRIQEDIKKIVERMDYDREAEKVLNEIYQETEKLTRDVQKMIGERPPYVGNYFAIINHKTQQALAYGSSIGTAFGGKLGTEGIVMNNFNMDTLKNFEKTGPFYGLMEPLIVTKANEIHTVYAGTAGHSSVSLDMPRKMTTLAYSLFHNFTLQQAFTMPLIYSHNPNEIIVKGEIPYWRLTNISEIMGEETGTNVKIVKPERGDFMDEAGAVQGRSAVQFMGKRQWGTIMPNGI